ncbi:MAG: cobalamin-binding protein [Blastocatellia bacterium]|nr:cobalamin-binding protein [Blastocatellia bacterium]
MHRILSNKLFLCLIVALLAPICSDCRFNPAKSETNDRRTLTDGLGRTISIRPNPQRIISLAPSVTEILFALGLGDRVAGVTSYCDFPEEAKSKEKIGDTLHPNLERIIALKPDLVIISTASQLEELMRKLDQLGVPVYVTNPRTVGETVDSIQNIGEATGAGARGAEIAADLRRRIDAVDMRVKGLPKPRVLYLLQTDPLITAGRNTFINDLIKLAGGESISGDETADYPQFSRETVIARAPEVIVAPSSHGQDFVREEDLRREFSTTPALRTNRIIKVNSDWVDRPGPRIVDGLEQLARGLHP